MTDAAIEARLWYSLSLSTIRWRKATKHEYASIDSWNATHTINLPVDQDEEYTLRYLIHELAHVSLHSELGPWTRKEEKVLYRVVEPDLMDYLLSQRHKHEKWLTALRAAGYPKKGKGRERTST